MTPNTSSCSPAVHRDGNERPTFPFHETYISPGFCSNGGVPEKHLPEAARQHIVDWEVVDPDVIHSGGHSGVNVSYLPVAGPSVAVKKISSWVLSCLMGIVKWSQESDPSGPKVLLQKAKDAERLMRERDQHLKQKLESIYEAMNEGSTITPELMREIRELKSKIMENS